MTERAETLPPRSLPFVELAKTGVGALFGNFLAFLQMAVLPILLFSLSWLAIQTYAPHAIASLLATVIDRAMTTMFGMAWLAYLLLPPSDGNRWLPRWSREHTIFLLYALLIGVLLWVHGIAIHLISTEWRAFYRSHATATNILLALPIDYVHASIGLVFCALAVKQPGGPIWSWRLMGWSAVKVMVVAFVATFCLSFLGGFVSGFMVGFFRALHVGGSTLTLLVALPRTFANYASYAVTLGLLAFAYRQLTGWPGPRREILERFE